MRAGSLPLLASTHRSGLVRVRPARAHDAVQHHREAKKLGVPATPQYSPGMPLFAKSLGLLLTLIAAMSAGQAVAATALPLEAPTSCPVGAAARAEADLWRPILTPPIVLGCGNLPHLGGQFQAVAYRAGKSAATSLLCEGSEFNDGSITSCGDPPLKGTEFRLIFSGGGNRWWEMHGRTTGRVAYMTLRYRSFGRVRKRRVSLSTVSDPAFLSRLGVKRSFGVYQAEMSPHARWFSLVARDLSGKLIDRVGLDLSQL
jgi:hypothetical protein